MFDTKMVPSCSQFDKFLSMSNKDYTWIENNSLTFLQNLFIHMYTMICEENVFPLTQMKIVYLVKSQVVCGLEGPGRISKSISISDNSDVIYVHCVV